MSELENCSLTQRNVILKERSGSMYLLIFGDLNVLPIPHFPCTVFMKRLFIIEKTSSSPREMALGRFSFGWDP